MPIKLLQCSGALPHPAVAGKASLRPRLPWLLLVGFRLAFGQLLCSPSVPGKWASLIRSSAATAVAAAAQEQIRSSGATERLIERLGPVLLHGLSVFSQSRSQCPACPSLRCPDVTCGALHCAASPSADWPLTLVLLAALCGFCLGVGVAYKLGLAPREKRLTGAPRAEATPEAAQTTAGTVELRRGLALTGSR